MTDSGASTPDAAFETAPAGSPDVRAVDAAEAEGGVEAERSVADAGAVSGERRRRRRRWGRWRRTLVVLLVLACLAAGGLAGAEHYARTRLVPTVHTAMPGLSDDATITTEGLLLPQVLRHELTTLSIRADSLMLEADAAADDADAAGSGLAAVSSVELKDVTANLTAVDIRAPYRVGRVDASAVIGFDELEWIVAAAVPDVPDLTITPQTYGSATEPGRVTAATTTVLGLDASLTIEPRVTDAGGLELDIVNARVAGMDIDVDSDDDGSFGVSSMLLSHFGLTTSTIEVGSEVLPAGMTLSQVYIARGGAHLTLSGTDVTLADW